MHLPVWKGRWRPHLPTLLVWGLILASLLGVSGWVLRPIRSRPVQRVHLLPVQGMDGSLSARQRRALDLMMASDLEALSPVSLLTEYLGTSFPPGTVQVQTRVEVRDGLWRLHLQHRIEGGAWVEDPGVWLPFHQAIQGWFARLPVPVDAQRLATLYPPEDGAAWEALRDAQLVPLDPATWWEHFSRQQEMAERHPRSVQAWCALGRAAMAMLLGDPVRTPMHREACEQAYGRALALWPGHPEAASALAQVRSDLGDHRGALTMLREARRENPFSTTVLRKLAYSARMAGLLPVAVAAVSTQERISGVPLAGIENALLYQGDPGRFEAGLRMGANLQGWSPAYRFYDGYVALVRGDVQEARARFRVVPTPWGEARFGQMGCLFEHLAWGRRKEAKAAFDAIHRNTPTARYPDGEYLFKLGEAAALLGEDYLALDLVHRAATQGFHCLEWFDHSPFLARVREMPRFEVIRAFIRERREGLEPFAGTAAFDLDRPPRARG